MRHVQGPDLPTGGCLVEPTASIAEAYRTGRGSFRLRARWEREELAYGQYQVVVTEIPYQVQKGRLIERMAELLNLKKLPLLADLRDELTEAVRLVLVPRSRSITPELLMEQLFRTTELEVRLPLNMNVLDAAGVPRVMSLAEVLEAYLAHRMEVLIRRSRHRLAKVLDRLEVLEGYLKAFLDLDEVIRIIREEDEPKPALMARFELSDRQAEAILNLRLRNLRKLEEMELAQRAGQARRGAAGPGGAAGRRGAAAGAAEGAVRGGPEAIRRRGRWASGGPTSPRRRRSRRSCSRSRSSACRSPWSARARAGSAPCAVPPRTRPSSSTRRVTPSASSWRRRAPTGSGDRRRRPRLHAGGGQARHAAAAMASLCPWRSTSTRAWRSSTCACTGPRAGWCSPRPRASASSPRSRRSRPRPAPASRSSI